MKWRPLSLRTSLVLMILLAAVPLVLRCILLIEREVDASRAQHRADLGRVAASQAAAIDREIGSSIDLLRSLAHFESLARGDLPAFHKALATPQPLRPSWTSIYLVDRNGDVLLSSDQPFGKVLGNVAAMTDVEAARRTRLPVTSGVRSNVLNGLPSTVVHVPVMIDGDVRYVLGAWIAPSWWQGMLLGRTLPPGHFMALFDAGGRVIAQSLQGRRALVEPLPPALAASAPPERADLPQLGSTYLAWQPIAPFGWRVLVGATSTAIDAPHREGLAAAAIGGLLALVAGLVLALLVARRVAEPLERLARLDLAGSGTSTPVREIAQLRDVLLQLVAQREGHAGVSPVSPAEPGVDRPAVVPANETPWPAPTEQAPAVDLAHEEALPPAQEAALPPAVVAEASADMAVEEAAEEAAEEQPPLDLEIGADEPAPPVQEAVNLAAEPVVALPEGEAEPEAEPTAAAPQDAPADLALPPVPVEAAAEAAGALPAEESLPSPRRVVVVQENADALDTLRVMLERDGHAVRTAVDGIAGLALIVQTRPDIALIDVTLPRLDGLEMAGMLRARGLKMRLVALSADADDGLDGALAAGFDSHLARPIDPAALQSELKRV